MRSLFVLLFSFSVLAPSVEAADRVPFYFPAGVVKTTDPVLQMQEYIRYLMATHYRFQGNHHNDSAMIPGSDSIVVQTDIDSTSSVATDEVQKCRIVLDHFVRMPDGKIRVTHLSDQFFISEDDLKFVADDLIKLVREAAQSNYEYYKDLASVAIETRASRLFPLPKRDHPTPTVSTTKTALSTEAEIFKKALDDKDPLYHGVTLRELHHLPRPVKVSDFVPRELHLGYNPEMEGILGACWLNSGIVYYNPQARILDYLTGRPKVLQHEMVHCNPNIEKFPFTSGFDAELFAMFPEVFFDENKLDLFFHNYCEDLREITEIYFGFDFAEAKRQIVRYNLAGSLVIDPIKWKEYSDKIDRTKRELSHAVRDRIIPEFYSDPLWWSSMHHKLRDENGLFWIMMAKYYRPTILGSARETAVWLSKYHDEIVGMAEEAFRGSGNDDGGGVIIVGDRTISISHLYGLTRFLDPDERRRIVSYFENNPKAVKKISTMRTNEAIRFISLILRKRSEVMGLEK